MTMSWLAEKKATRRAKNAVPAGFSAGLVDAMATIDAISAAWVAMAQPRRRPSSRPRTGSVIRSITGAHRNLNVYGVLTREKRPMAVSETPSILSQTERVENTSSRGRPLENPRNRMTSIRRSR